MLSVQEDHKKELELTPPRHVAIIMDGNGRWAKQKKLPKIAGHKKGAEAVRTCVESCVDQGISYLTLYAFSSENWSRPVEEVKDLMGLLRRYLTREIDNLHKKNIRISFIGERSRLGSKILDLIEMAEQKTRGNERMHLILALSYGAQAEITDAVRQIAEKVKAGEIDPQDIDEKLVADHLYTSEIPEPDLIIRTSGEKRLSNFLLWQAAYAEFYFTDLYWPDFSSDSLKEAIDDYHKRDRRYGARS